MEQRLILFTLGGQGYAFDLQEVAEVMEPPESFPIPKAPAHFVGLINFHGALTALVDLGLFLGQRGPARQPGKVLVLDPRLASLALGVDGVSSVVAESAVLARTEGSAPHIAQELETEYGTYLLLRVEPLLSALEEGLSGSA